MSKGSLFGGRLVVIVSVSFLSLGGPIGPASAQSDCDVSPLTASPGEAALVPPAASADGSLVAFVSSHDPTGGNADGSLEVFLFDTASGTFLQVTDSADAAFADLSVSADGNRVAFSSDLDFDGSNPDRNSEVWFFDRDAGAITQVTTTFEAGVGNVQPVIDAAGMTIVFVSDQGVVDGGNADSNPEVVAFDVDSSSFSLVTDTPSGESRSPALGALGALVFFVSSADPTGGNADGGEELFVFDRGTGVTTQLTSDVAGGSISGPSASSDGSLVAFSSDRDPIGDNNDRNLEVFVVETATGVVRQVTKATGTVGSFDAALSGDGARVVFASDANHSNRNADGNVEIFRIDLADGALVQATDAPGASSRFPATFGDGARFFFLSTLGADGSVQLYSAGDCVVPPSVRVVKIDIMPRSRHNRIDVDSRLRVRVAILSTSVADGDAIDFDARTVAPRSVRFGPDGARETKSRIRLRDVDDDGDLDMILHFKISETGIDIGDTEACLTGLTGDGAAFEGCDMVDPFRGRRR